MVTFALLTGLAVLGALGSAAHGEFVVPGSPDDSLVFGVSGGVHVALHPSALDDREHGGPRGLLRVGLEHEDRLHLANYIAVEPVVGGKRGYSELERSADGRAGKRFELVGGDGEGDGDGGALPASKTRHPSRGEGEGAWVIEETDDGRVLRFTVRVEPFGNGARPLVEVALFEDDPMRVRFRVNADDGSAPMQRCVLTATMGNQARCRDLWLAKRVESAREMFTSFGGNGFAPPVEFGGRDLYRTRYGDVVVAITSDEAEPSETWPFENGAWRHTLPWLAQAWIKPAGTYGDELVARVNGRRVYWAGNSPIPGGPSIENFELDQPFRPGDEVWFAMSYESPREAFGFRRGVQTVRRTVTRHEQSVLDGAGPLRNGDFADGFDGWYGNTPFRLFEADGQSRLTTHGRKGDADQGRLWQAFRVPDDARFLRLFVHGGDDAERVNVALWDGPARYRWATGRDWNEPFEVRWDLRPVRGRVVTLEIADRATGQWGFIGVHGIEIVSE